MDMREFLNAPNGSSQPTVTANGRQESGSPQSPLGGKTVWMPDLYMSHCWFPLFFFPLNLHGSLPCIKSHFLFIYVGNFCIVGVTWSFFVSTLAGCLWSALSYGQRSDRREFAHKNDFNQGRSHWIETLSPSYNCCFSIHTCFHYFMVIISDDNQARMTQLQDAQKGAEVTSEATDRELELEAQLVEARSIIQEQVCAFYILFILSEWKYSLHKK